MQGPFPVPGGQRPPTPGGTRAPVRARRAGAAGEPVPMPGPPPPGDPSGARRPARASLPCGRSEMNGRELQRLSGPRWEEAVWGFCLVLFPPAMTIPYVSG